MTKKHLNKRPNLIATAVAGIVLAFLAMFLLKIDYWLLPPAKKMAASWKADIDMLEKSGKLPKQWKDIREVTIKADNSQIQEWLKDLQPPIHRNREGNFRLEVFLVHWIEGYRYGAVVQYHLVDLRNQNTIWEDGRTFKLGFVY